MSALGQGVEQPDGGELGSAVRGAGQNGDDLHGVSLTTLSALLRTAPRKSPQSAA